MPRIQQVHSRNNSSHNTMNTFIYNNQHQHSHSHTYTYTHTHNINVSTAPDTRNKKNISNAPTMNEIPTYSRLIGALCAHEKQRALQLKKRKRSIHEINEENRTHLNASSPTPSTGSSIASTDTNAEMDGLSDSDESIYSEVGSWSCLDSGDDDLTNSHHSNSEQKPHIQSNSQSLKQLRRNSASHTHKIPSPLIKSTMAVIPSIDHLSLTRNTYSTYSSIPITSFPLKAEPLNDIFAQSTALATLLEMADDERSRLKSQISANIGETHLKNQFSESLALKSVLNSLTSIHSKQQQVSQAVNIPVTASKEISGKATNSSVCNVVCVASSASSNTNVTSTLSSSSITSATNSQSVSVVQTVQARCISPLSLHLISTAVPATTVRATNIAPNTVIAQPSKETAIPAAVLSSRNALIPTATSIKAIPAVSLTIPSQK